MKRWYALLIAIVLVLTITACGANDTEPTVQDTIPSTQDTLATQPVTEPTAESTAPTEPTVESTTSPTEVQTETKPQSGVYGDTLVLGNIKFTIPEGFLVTVIDENTFQLSTSDLECSIGLFAADISDLDEETTETYLPLQHELFMNEEATRFEESELDGFIAGFDVAMDFYGQITGDLLITTNMDFTFTDSWYAYTIIFYCDATSEILTDHTTAFVEFIGYSEYLGESPRFEFVQ